MANTNKWGIVAEFDSAAAIYTAAQQVADFGSAQASVTVRVVQLSTAIGRGTPAVATL